MRSGKDESVLAGFIYMVLYGILMANTREDWVTPLKPGIWPF